MNNSIKIACLGESKVQQLSHDDGSQSFACFGDVLTTAIYLVRSGLKVSFISVLEELSKKIICKSLQEEGLNTDLVLTDENHAFFSSDDFESIQLKLSEFDFVYLTGNTLLLLDDAGIEKLIQLLVSLRKRGGKVIFDSNHSSKSWSSDELARAVYTKFLRVTDVSLPSFVDEADLFQDRAVEDLIARHHALGIREVVVKNGTEANWLSTKPDKKPREFPLESIQKAIDNSGVGDAFNAAYLATRLSGQTYCSSIKQGQLLAAEVVVNSGAILPKS
jgi:2-dehydro-3-deoxygluconokinase